MEQFLSRGIRENRILLFLLDDDRSNIFFVLELMLDDNVVVVYTLKILKVT